MVEHDFIALSQDRISLWCVDKVETPVLNGEPTTTETAMDLTGLTPKFYYRINGGSVVEAVMTPRTQTGDDVGWCDYDWQTDELAAGDLEGELWVFDGGGKPQGAPRRIRLSILDDLRSEYVP